MVAPEILRDRIGRVVAATRFPFVGQDDWDEERTTIVNDHKNKQWGFKTPVGVLYPSVVVLNPNGGIRECGEVEVDSEFTEEHVRKWRLMSSLTGMGEKYKKFFLYVPEGTEKEAERLLAVNGIEYAGLRTWRLEDWNLVLKPYLTPDMVKDHR